MEKKSRNRKIKRSIEFFTLNISIIPANHENETFYSDLIESFYLNDTRIIKGKDFYYTMIHLSLLEVDEKKVYYGIFSKFLQLETIDWVKTEEIKRINSAEISSIPEGLEGRKGMYEFIFVPDIHKMAFIKKGKIDESIKKQGAPLIAIRDVIKIGLEQLVTKEHSVHVDIVKSKQVIDKIFSSTLLKLDLKLHYTNPDITDDHEKYMDDLYRDSEATNIDISLKGDADKPINSDSTFIKGNLKLTRKNGNAKALIINENGQKERINTEDHPSIDLAEVTDYKSTLVSKLIFKVVNLLRNV